jgi:alpha-1,2-mannosyltransferase
VVLATTCALALRLFTLTRPGYLTGITEYDDGVYLGAAIRMTEGAIPYRDFAFIQPPGIVLLMSPVALVAAVTTTVKALALARVLTALASAACVPLAGRLVRHHGPVATLVTCGVLAVYPDDISTAHTLMLEPWMNLLCLLAVTAAFRDGRLKSARSLLWAGVLMGLAAAVKFWAVVPAAILLAVCLSARDARARRTLRYVTGLAVGLAVPLAPFALAAPVTLVRATITDQAVRAGTAVPIDARLAHLTGLIDVLDVQGHFNLNAGTTSLYAAGSSAPLDPGSSLAWLPYLVAAAMVMALLGGFLRRARALSSPLSPLDWFSVATAALACAAVLSYSAFFYHYPDFPAPWLALTAGGAAGALALSRGRELSTARRVTASITVALALVAALQVREIYPMTQVTAQAIAHKIPRGSCVITDEVSLTIAADRFTGYPSYCPVIVDSLAQTLVLSNGLSVQGGAASDASVVAAWKSWLSRADYVWLTPGSGAGQGSARRIPWTPALLAWFYRSFTGVGSYSRGTGQLYVRNK